MKIKIKDIKKIYDFMGISHKQVNNNYEEVAEIRALRRDKEGARPLRSFTYYKYNEKQLEYLTKQIEELDALEIPYCLYYSVYSFNSKEGKRVNTNNSISTSILVSDYDHINEEEFRKYLDKLIKIGLEPNYTVFTGHGYQTIHILDEASTDKDLLSKYTNLLLKKGFPVDTTIKDSARIMRLPYTYNNKDPKKPIATFIYSEKPGAYNLDNIFNTLNKLETIPGYKEEIKKVIPAVAVEEAEEKELTYFDNDFLKATYINTSIIIDKTPAPIKAILMGLRNGKSDKMIRGLTLYLRDYAGLSLEDIIEINKILINLDTYNYVGDVKLDIDRKVKSLFYKYDYKFSYTDVKEFGDMSNKVVDNSIMRLDNYMLKQDNISNIAFYINLKLLLEKHYKHNISFTIDEIATICNKSRQKIKPKLDELVKAGLIDKRRAYKKEGGKYYYTLSKYCIDKTQGFTNINTFALGTLVKALDEGKTNATVVRFLLLVKSFIRPDECNIAIDQATISKFLNITQSAVSKLWDKVEELNKLAVYPYITREADWLDQDKFIYIYEVHF